MTILKDSEMTGKRVILEDASNIGTVNDIFVDTRDWRITKFDVKLDSRYIERLGVEKKFMKKAFIPVRIHLLKSVGDVVHVKGSIEDLKKSLKKVVPGSTQPASTKKAQAAPSKPAQPATRPAAPPPKEEEKPRSL
jgi:sporulation protein YlmC with PRC-barrel domain